MRVIAETLGCRVYPPLGLPETGGHLEIPGDLAEFYGLCGGVDLYEGKEFPISIVRPPGFRPSNLELMGEQFPEDVSSAWYTIAQTSDSEYLSIDLSPERHGRCYDCFHEIHGIVGSNPVVALGFTDLLKRLVGNGGRRWYWLGSDFAGLGDAYD